MLPVERHPGTASTGNTCARCAEWINWPWNCSVFRWFMLAHCAWHHCLLPGRDLIHDPLSTFYYLPATALQDRCPLCSVLILTGYYDWRRALLCAMLHVMIQYTTSRRCHAENITCTHCMATVRQLVTSKCKKVAKYSARQRWLLALKFIVSLCDVMQRLPFNLFALMSIISCIVE